MEKNGLKTMLEKVKMTKRNLKTPATRGNAGFTAIEIAMVAAVIAILSLIVLPVFRNRVEDAKIAAAQADLSALMKAQQVVKADIDGYARLEDLDNVQLFGYATWPTNGIDKEVPAFKYENPTNTAPPADTRHILSDIQRGQLAGSETIPRWKGPYIAFQRHILEEDLATLDAAAFLLANNAGGPGFSTAPERPIQNITGGDQQDHPQSRIPVDPWGNPYLFFPPTGNRADVNAAGDEFPSSVIYSMGPNGMPGNGDAAANTVAYTREGTLTLPDGQALGEGDDLMVEF